MTLHLKGEHEPINLERRTETGMRYVRWRHISLVFQGAMNSLDPVQKVDAQFAEAIRLHSPSARARARCASGPQELLATVGLTRGARAPLRPPALGRPAPAGDDRARAGLQPLAGDRRRADHRPRRGHAGAGAAAARAPARAPRPGADPDLARPRRAGRDLRPDRGHVRGADRRDRAGGGGLRRPAASVHEAPARDDADDRRQPRARGPDPRRPARSRASRPRAAASSRAARTRRTAAGRGPGAARGRRRPTPRPATSRPGPSGPRRASRQAWRRGPPDEPTAR